MLPTDPLRPVIPDNARPLRLTAAAGTKLAGAILLSTVIILLNQRVLQLESLHHSCSIAGSSFRSLSNIPYCCLIYKSLDLVSVPMWLIILSDQLKIVGLVSHYLTNYLILYELI